MYDLTTLNRRYFGIKIEDTCVQVLPPKLKILRRFENMNEADMMVGDLIEVLSQILSKNKENIKIPQEFIEDNLDIDEMTALLEVYFSWVAKANNDPN